MLCTRLAIASLMYVVKIESSDCAMISYDVEYHQQDTFTCLAQQVVDVSMVLGYAFDELVEVLNETTDLHEWCSLDID